MTDDRRRSNFVAALLGALLVALPVVGLALGGVFESTTQQQPPATSPAPASDASPAVAPARSATDVSALYERVRAGVVSIQTSATQQTPLGEQPGGGSGSGFVIDREGHILTNDHVVEDADSIRVRFTEGPAVTARVVGTDPSTDLALLKIDPDDRDLTPLALGASNELKVGQPAIAIGNPFGLDGTLTTGVVSALGRSIDAPNRFQIENVVQTDAAINPGNSGGPLLDASGRVIGVNAQIASRTGANSGVGFAVPIDAAKQILPQLKAGKAIKRPYLGVTTGPTQSDDGALVDQILPGSPADDAGLRARDVIVSIADAEVNESSDVSRAVAARQPGDKIAVRIRRGGDERTITVTLATRPSRIAE